jgi:hypothetical protein
MVSNPPPVRPASAKALSRRLKAGDVSSLVYTGTLGFRFSPHFSAGRLSQFHRSSGDEYSSLSPSASRDAIAFDVGSLWEFRRQETLATESVGAAAVPRREALIMAALTSFLYRSHKISL